MASKYTTAQLVAVLELRRAGYKAREITDLLHIPQSSIYSIIARAKALGPGRQLKGRIDYKRIIELARQGLSHRQIAAEVGCGRSTVSMVLKDAGVAGTRPKSSGYDHETIGRVIRHYAEGASLKRLAELEDMDRKSIRSILVSAGIKIRSSKQQGSARIPFLRRWRLVSSQDDDEHWRHVTLGIECYITDRGIEALPDRFIALEPELGAFETRDAALDAVEAAGGSR